MSSCQSMLDLSERTWSDNSSCSANPSFNCQSSCIGQSTYLRTMSTSYNDTDLCSEFPAGSTFSSNICSDTSTILDSSSCKEFALSLLTAHDYHGEIKYDNKTSQSGNHDLWETEDSKEQGKVSVDKHGKYPVESCETETSALVESGKTDKSEKKVPRESENKEKIEIRTTRELNYSAHSLDLCTPKEPGDQEDFKETRELGKGFIEPRLLGELREPVELETSGKQDESGENQGKLGEHGDPRKKGESRETEEPTAFKESLELFEEREEQEKLKEPETPRAKTEIKQQLQLENQEEPREPFTIVKPVKPGSGLRSLNHSDSFVLNTTLRSFASPRRRLILRPKDVKAKRQK